MKKALSIILILLLALSILPAGALASDVVQSLQNLRADGKSIECEKYNIDGSNYFKLRDIAMILNGTGSRFYVGWDAEKKVISVETGRSYEPNGSELDLSGCDKSATAVPSTQTLLIDGVERSDLSAWNIGGNNFFKLRDLGDALGFKVDYDKPSNTAIIVSRSMGWLTPWHVVETIYNENGAATSHDVTTYDENGFLVDSLYEDEYSSDHYSYVYDELGRVVKESYESKYEIDGETIEGWSTTEYTYDIWGLLVSETFQSMGDDIRETTYTYDGDGNLLVMETVSNMGRSATYYTYDDNGYQIASVMTEEDEVMSSQEFTVDEEGNVVRSVFYDGNGEVFSVAESVYKDGRLVEATYNYGDQEVQTSRYTYDEDGFMIRSETESGSYHGVNTYIYDERKNLVQSEYVSNDYSSLSVWTYDENDLQLRMESSSSSGDYEVEERSYDEEGNILTVEYSGYGMKRTENYTYDREAGKKTVLVVYEYEGMG